MKEFFNIVLGCLLACAAGFWFAYGLQWGKITFSDECKYLKLPSVICIDGVKTVVNPNGTSYPFRITQDDMGRVIYQECNCSNDDE